MSDEVDKIVSEYINKICEPIFTRFAKETPSNLMLVGKQQSEGPDFTYYQPHNIRRVFDFSHKEKDLTTYLSKLKKVGMVGKLINHDSEIIIKDFYGCQIRIRKNTIQFTNKIDHKRWYALDYFQAERQIREITQKKEKEIIVSFKQFLHSAGGETQFKLISAHDEPKFQNNIMTEALQEDWRWHKKKHKKVYNKKVIELSNITDAIRMMDQAVALKIVPEIAEPMRVLAEAAKQSYEQAHRSNKSLEFLIDHIKTLEDGIYYKESVEKLSEEDKYKLAEALWKNRVFGEPIKEIEVKIRKVRLFG